MDQDQIEAYSSPLERKRDLLDPLKDFDGEVVTPVNIEDLVIGEERFFSYLEGGYVNRVLPYEEYICERSRTGRFISKPGQDVWKNTTQSYDLIQWSRYLTALKLTPHCIPTGYNSSIGVSERLGLLSPFKHPTAFAAVVDPYLFADKSTEADAEEFVQYILAIIEPFRLPVAEILFFHDWRLVGTLDIKLPRYEQDKIAKAVRKSLYDDIRKILQAKLGFDCKIAFFSRAFSEAERLHDRYVLSQGYILKCGSGITSITGSLHLSELEISCHSGRLWKCGSFEIRLKELEYIINRYHLDIIRGANPHKYSDGFTSAQVLEWFKGWRKLVGLP